MIITMCGSIHNEHGEELFHKWGLSLALAGHTPLGLSCYNCYNCCTPAPVVLSVTQKAILDGAHLRRISMSGAILVLNEGGYVGQSVMSEMVFASDTGKRMLFLEPHLCAPDANLVHFEFDKPSTIRLCEEGMLYTFDSNSVVDGLLDKLGRGGGHTNPHTVN